MYILFIYFLQWNFHPPLLLYCSHKYHSFIHLLHKKWNRFYRKLPYEFLFIIYYSLPDIPNFGSPQRNQGSVQNEQSSFRKIVNSYGSVPPFCTSSYTPRGGSFASPNIGKGATPPPLLYGTQSNPYKPVTQEMEQVLGITILFSSMFI